MKLKKEQVIAVCLAIVVVGIFVYTSNQSVDQVKDQTASVKGLDNTAQMNKQEATTTPSATELKIVDTVMGTGAEAKTGNTITVHYTGKLTNGQVFDSSVTRGTPFTFKLGEGRVIQGWEQGFAGMKVGGKRTLTIPPQLGYGANPIGTIPANSTLIFDVELLKVQ